MPIVSVADFRSDENGFGGGKADGEELPPFGPGDIYHEKQVGALCAVHCLNNLMQGPAFNEVALAEVAQQLDAEERRLLGGAGLASADGGNVRADGFFNVQVIRAGLQRAGFEMELIKTASALTEPAKQRGFICNRKEHWFSFRRIGQEWFDLNSCLRTPKHFTDPELVSFVSEALTEGYAVFNVKGTYPPCELESNSKKLLEAVQGCGHARQTHTLFSGQGQTLSGKSSGSAPAVDPELLAMAEHDPELAAALAASLQEAQAASPPAPVAESMADIRAKRLARFG